MDKIEFDLDLFAEELPDQAQYFGTGPVADSVKTATAFTAASTVSGSTASSVSTLSAS
ncbi:MAG: hypothetical protein QOJ39_2778 [Candidatus Eremiobacteraeota bacterium]|jgi:hypothetical protein|nr:hypothetical protein [Candidatus Eremiobacteraeota bacterium]MEA2720914.1 hypothetical protein [Candidatus Eremiobacteraeota bacterium]